jgi:amino acid adenylation domain-containing protein
MLSQSVGGALKELSRKEGVTLFMILLAAFQTLLYRYSGQEDICVGTPIAGRTRAEFEGLIGLFVNTLVLRTDLSGKPSFRDLLERVRETAVGAYKHQELPFEMLVEALQPERNLSHTPLFQVMFALQNMPSTQLELPGLKVDVLQIDRGTAKFDLTLTILEASDGLYGALEYNTALFDAETICRMVGHFQTLLAAIVADPDQPIVSLPLLTDAERQQLLGAWNATAIEYPRDQCVHQLVEAWVARTPEAVALVFEGQELTYRELNARANQLAHHLRRLGVRPQTLVGICVDRSLELVVGMLGILKAGGAYVPLDPTYPQERLAWMLADTGAPVLVTLQRLVEQLPAQAARLICLDADQHTIAQECEENPASGATAGSPVYVMYTSGSTGLPKGIVIPHRAINRLVCNTNYIQLEPSDRIAQASNASFDAATFEIWGALLHGARIVGITRDTALAPQEFAAQIREQEINVLFLTTALFNQLAREAPSAFHTVRDLMFGGEAVDPRWVREVLTHGPPQRLLHVYGPTESTTFASWCLVQEVRDDSTTIPIGRPIANTQLYVLDRHAQPVPIGVPGELYISGDGLALQYLNRPELTAERFVPDPFSAVLGRYMYKTGDRVRYLADGSIEFLGRIDQQVKIRGFRVEPGEIEAVLSQHPALREVIVLAREDTPGDKRLVMYVVPAHDSAPMIGQLRAFLKQRLPEYMVPSAVVILPALPLTPNGKVDRRVLPAPDGSRALENPYVAPRTQVEEQLAAIGTQLLSIERIGIHDNFFDLGGHSLLATQLISRVRDTFQIELPLRSLFEHPTVAELAEVIEQARENSPRLVTPAIVALSRESHRMKRASILQNEAAVPHTRDATRSE